MRDPIVAVYVEASRQIGGGHVMRCLALVEALHRLGWMSQILCTAETVATVPGITKAAANTIVVQDDDWLRSERIGAYAGPTDLLVIDHYGRDAAFHSGCRNWARKILVLDDLANREYDCDFLSDMSLDRRDEAYACRITKGAQLLLGAAYAPLRPEFSQFRSMSLHRRGRQPGIDRIFVSLGMLDHHRHTIKVLKGLENAGFDGIADIVFGSASPIIEAVREQQVSVRFEIRIHVDSTEVARLMSEADLAIGAGGISSWERCALGVPSLVTLVADNQLANLTALHSHGAGISLGRADFDLSTRIADHLSVLRDNPDRLRAMSRSASLLCDGRGANRLASVLDAPRASDGRPVWLRPVKRDDVELMFTWQSNEETRRFARVSTPPTWDEHVAWFDGKLCDPDCTFSVIMHGNDPRGALRLDREHSSDVMNSENYKISIFVAPEYHGKRIGSAALSALRKLVPYALLHAEIIAENVASRRMFLGAGYEDIGGGQYQNQPRQHASLPSATAY